jgi:hypothetical protein
MFRSSFSASSNNISPTLFTATQRASLTSISPACSTLEAVTLSLNSLLPHVHGVDFLSCLHFEWKVMARGRLAQRTLKVERMNTMKAFVKKERFVHVVSNSYPFSLRAQSGLCWYGNQCHDQH